MSVADSIAILNIGSLEMAPFLSYLLLWQTAVLFIASYRFSIQHFSRSAVFSENIFFSTTRVEYMWNYIVIHGEDGSNKIKRTEEISII